MELHFQILIYYKTTAIKIVRHECKDWQIDQNRHSRDKATYIWFMSKVACRVATGEYQNMFSRNGEEVTPIWQHILKNYFSSWIMDLNINIKRKLLEDNVAKYAHYLIISMHFKWNIINILILKWVNFALYLM